MHVDRLRCIVLILDLSLVLTLHGVLRREHDQVRRVEVARRHHLVVDVSDLFFRLSGTLFVQLIRVYGSHRACFLMQYDIFIKLFPK